MSVDELAQHNDAPPVWFGLLLLVLLIAFSIYGFRARYKVFHPTWHKADTEFAENHAHHAAGLIAPTDRLIRGLRSPLVPAGAWEDWEKAKAEFAQAPRSTSAIDKVYAANSNATYLSGIETGDPWMRRQLINELMTEAKIVNAQPVYRDIAALRGRENSPSFVDEFLRVIDSVGVYSHARYGEELQRAKADYSLIRGLSEYGLQASPMTSRDFFPGAGRGGFFTAMDAWKGYGFWYGDQLVDPSGSMSDYSKAQAYRRWLRGDLG